MIKFSTIGEIEKGYYFEDAVIDTAMLNGTFGSIADGKFTAGADKNQVIMQIETGDDEYMDEYLIPAGSHVRVLDLEKLAKDFDTFEIYGYPLPDTVAKGNKLKSDESGKLVANDGKYEVTRILGNHAGAEIKITAGE